MSVGAASTTFRCAVAASSHMLTLGKERRSGALPPGCMAEASGAPVVDPMDASELRATRHSDPELHQSGYGPPATMGQSAVVSADVTTTMGVASGFVVPGVQLRTSSASAQLVGRRTAFPETRRALAPETTVGHLPWWHIGGARVAEREGSCPIPGATRSSALDESSQTAKDPSARS